MNDIHPRAQKTAAALTAFALVKNQKVGVQVGYWAVFVGIDICVVPFQCVGQGFFDHFSGGALKRVTKASDAFFGAA